MINKEDQIRMAERFRRRHKELPLLLLPNVWDPMSARLFAIAGFSALATTSGGLAWALGYPDGEAAPWTELVAATQRIVSTVQVPVTADIEAGYGATPQEVATHVTEIIRAGIVGINLEDGLRGSSALIRSVEDATARIRAARDAAATEGMPIVINARSDLYHLQHYDERSRFTETVARCKAYLMAGADCVYPFGLRDVRVIAELVRAVGAPVNITGRAGMPDAAELERLGVARVTIASAPALVTMSVIMTLAKELRDTGNFEMLAAPLHYPDAQKLFAAKHG